MIALHGPVSRLRRRVAVTRREREQPDRRRSCSGRRVRDVPRGLRRAVASPRPRRDRELRRPPLVALKAARRVEGRGPCRRPGAQRASPSRGLAAIASACSTAASCAAAISGPRLAPERVVGEHRRDRQGVGERVDRGVGLVELAGRARRPGSEIAGCCQPSRIARSSDARADGSVVALQLEGREVEPREGEVVGLAPMRGARAPPSPGRLPERRSGRAGTAAPGRSGSSAATWRGDARRPRASRRRSRACRSEIAAGLAS